MRPSTSAGEGTQVAPRETEVEEIGKKRIRKLAATAAKREASIEEISTADVSATRQ